MLTSITIYDAATLNSIAVNNATYPLHDFTWHGEMVGDNLRRMDGPGLHANYKYVQDMPINMEGAILADSTSAYWTARKNLLNIVIPDFTQTLPIHGSIRMQIDGDSEIYFTRVMLEDWDVPLAALYPTVTQFQFQWTSIDGYWLKLSNFQAAKL